MSYSFWCHYRAELLCLETTCVHNKTYIKEKKNYLQVHCHIIFYFFSARPEKTTTQPPNNSYPKLPSTLNYPAAVRDGLLTWDSRETHVKPKSCSAHPFKLIRYLIPIMDVLLFLSKIQTFFLFKFTNAGFMVTIKSSLVWPLVLPSCGSQEEDQDELRSNQSHHSWRSWPNLSL